MEYSQMPVGCPWGGGKVGGVVEATNLSEHYCKPILNNSQQKLDVSITFICVVNNLSKK